MIFNLSFLFFLLFPIIQSKSGISEKDFSSKFILKAISTITLNQKSEILGLSATQSFLLQNATNILLNPPLTNKTLNGISLNSKFCFFIDRLIKDNSLMLLCNATKIITFTEDGDFLQSFYQDSAEGLIATFNEYQPNKFLLINNTMNRFEISLVAIDLLTSKIIPQVIYKDLNGELNFPRCYFLSLQQLFGCTYVNTKDNQRLNIISFTTTLKKMANTLVSSQGVGYYTAIGINDKLLIISISTSELMRRVIVINNSSNINVGSGIGTKIDYEVYSLNFVRLSKDMLMLAIETMTDIIIAQYDNLLQEHGSSIRFYIGIRESYSVTGVFNPLLSVYTQLIPMNYGNQLVLLVTLPQCRNITKYLELKEKERWDIVDYNQRIQFSAKSPSNPPEMFPIQLMSSYTMPLEVGFLIDGKYIYTYNSIEKTISKIGSGYGEVDIFSISCEIIFIICKEGELLNFNHSRCKTQEEIKNDMGNILDKIEEDILDMQKNLSLNDSTYQILNTTEEGKNESIANGNNLSQVMLGDCEFILKDFYDIPRDEPLLIFKMDTKDNEKLTNQVNYAVFMLNGTKLNLSICDSKSPITVITPIINITSEEIGNITELIDKGINPYDPQDDFFIDICYTYHKNGIDIPRNDRVKEELRDTSFICPANCTYSGLNKLSNRANCTCVPMESINPFTKIKDILLQSLTQGNWEMLECYELVFDKEILKSSIGSYMILAIDLLILITIGNFFCHKLKKLTAYCTIIHRKTKEKEEAMKIQPPNVSAYPLIVMDKEKDFIVDPNENNEINDEDNNRPKKTQDIKPINIVNNIVIYYNPMPIKFHPKKIMSVPQYNLEDYHRMDFKDLIINDHRTFCVLYWHYLQLTHPIINTFLMKSKVHLRPIQVSLFLINFIVTYALNALFYSDKNISNNYHNTGIEKFLYNLPVSLYTSLVVFIINLIFKLLSDPEPGITKIIKLPSMSQKKKVRSFLCCYKFRLVIVFILETLFMGFFWYCTAAFCGVYQKSQWEWLKSGAISTAIGIMIPFVVAIVCACFTKISLKYDVCFLYAICKIVA